MKVGIAAPVSLKLLCDRVEGGNELPEGYSFPSVSILIQEYLRRGHQVSVFALDPSTQQLKTFRGKQLTIHVGRYRPRHRARDFFAIERQDLLTAMKSDPCDIIHGMWTYEFALAAIASGYPHVITAHDAPLQILRLNLSPYRFMRTLMSFLVLYKTKNLTVVSPYLLKHFRRVFGYSRPIKVIPNGLAKSLFVLEERESKGTEDVITFVSVLNGWGGRKNSQVALQAFQQVREVIPKARLIMIGAGHGEGEEGSIWAKQRELHEQVEFVGRCPHDKLLKCLSTEADVLVHPALEESFCVAIAEAMALGIPVIGGSGSGAVPFTLENGKAGLLVDVRSPKSVAQAMLRLAQDPKLRSRLGSTGRQLAQQRFHIENVAIAYEELYQEILAGSLQFEGKHVCA